MVRKKTTPQERQARAAAGGYQRGAHQEHDSIKNKNRIVAASIELQDRVLDLYKEYAETYPYPIIARQLY